MGKRYAAQAEAYSMTGRRNQALAVGECILQCLEKVRECNRQHRLKDGTVQYRIAEQRVRDTDGKKGFRYIVQVKMESTEPEEETKTE